MKKAVLPKHKAFLFTLMVALLSVLISCGGTTTTERNDEISIGVLFPLTGDAGSYGERGKNGVELAVSEINKNGGIGGKKIRVIYEDSKADPTTGVTAMTKLATVDKVPAVIGDIVSATTLAAAPVAESNKVVLLAPTASAPAITQAGNYVFRIWASDLTEGKALATFATHSGFKNVAVLYMQNDYGIAIQDVFSKTFSGLGGKITASLSYKPEESDFRSYITKLTSGNPDAIYVVGYYKDSAIAMKQARELGVKTQFLGTTAIEDPKIFEVAGNAVEGVIYPLATGFDANSSNEKVQTFRKNYVEQFNSEPDWVPAHTYEAIMLLAYVMQHGGGITGEGIQKTMSQVKGYQGITGEITFDENGDVVKPVTIKIIQDNSFKIFEGMKQAATSGK